MDRLRERSLTLAGCVLILIDEDEEGLSGTYLLTERPAGTAQSVDPNVSFRSLPQSLKRDGLTCSYALDVGSMLFYLGGMFVAELLVPLDDESLLKNHNGTGRSSAFVVAFNRAGWKVFSESDRYRNES